MIEGVRIRPSVVTILSILGIIVSTQSSRECSSFCVCDTWYELERASCTGRHLYSIHTGVPSSVQALDLSDNVISSLNNFELADLGLTKLKYLNVSGNTISEIGLNAFNYLTELTVLDLSKNHLYYILDDVFVKNNNLRILKLSRNSFNSQVPKLNCPWLTELSLDSCQISHLPPDTFNGLTYIRRLDLSNNLMIQMSSAALQTLHFLRKLSLQGNPWSCNKIMYDLEILLSRKNVEFDEICSKGAAPLKFEKMIVPTVTRPTNYRRKVIESETKQVNRYNVSYTFGSKNISEEKNIHDQVNAMKSINDILPYCFVLIGFVLGVASGMVISYIWLAGSFSCRRRCRQREFHSDDSQRLSLLLNSWHLQDRTLSSVELTESCPGTPPPPYREVILRPNIYRCLGTSPTRIE